MKAILLKSTLVALGLTTAFWPLSSYSTAFDRSRVTNWIRSGLFRLLVVLGMNPHQPSDAAALTLLFYLLVIVAGATLWLVGSWRTR